MKSWPRRFVHSELYSFDEEKESLMNDRVQTRMHMCTTVHVRVLRSLFRVEEASLHPKRKLCSGS